MTQTEQNNKFKSWLLASRPNTLPAAVVPVMVGTALAYSEGKLKIDAAVIALLCSLLIQIGTNFVNDLYDFLKGTDKKERSGPTRALAAGWISINEMKAGIVISFGLCFLLGMYLVYLGGLPLFIIGVLSILAGIAYTAGPFPLAYNGLGDVFVFLFFGVVGTVGTYYVQTLRAEPIAFLASVPVGALITNILVVNNYRDTEEDRVAGKKTTAVIFGKRFARGQYIVLLLLSYMVPVVVYFLFIPKLLILIPLLSLPVGIKLISMLFRLKGKELNKALEITAKYSALYGLLFSIGLIL